jgi:hypothetical protein
MNRDEAGLKTRLEGALRRPISWTEWRHLKRLGIVDDFHRDRAALGKDEAWKEFRVSAAFHMKSLSEALKDNEREQAGVVDEGQLSELGPDTTAPLGEEIEALVFDTSESARARAISEYMSVIADQHPDVIGFRNSALGGNLVSAEEARAIIEKPGDVSTDLHRLANRLAELYPGWEAVGVMRFILTGQPPPLSLIKTRHTTKAFSSPHAPFSRHVSVTFTITLWVSAETVERVYRFTQRQYGVGKKRKTKPHTIEVAQFYWEQYRLEGKRLPWPALFQRWQEKHPDKGFKNWRAFREYAIRGRDATLPP